MPTKIGINGFGRIGRLDLRAAFDSKELEFVHINEPHANAQAAAHLLEFDTVHGRWDHEITTDEQSITIDGQTISYSSADTPGAVDWGEKGVELVLECSGKFRTPALLQPYFDQGIKKVIVAAPVKDGALNIVVG